MSRRGEEYDLRFNEMAAAGHNIHGEADFVESLGPRSVLDAGCGTGRVASELVRRGIAVVGVDADAEMLATARAKAPGLDWRLGDLTTVQLPASHFDVVVLAGNVMIFVEPGTEQAVIANLAPTLVPGGALVAGFQLREERMSLEDYDRFCEAAGLELAERWSTWDRKPWTADADYAVSVHRRRRLTGERPHGV
ncbi:MAG TPA: class I SAM-dependent methyltransferase [Acidimicrobiales bacterium]|nr:class I SAM-dependent methyltransferase [Acidimicrobiales bacterium]